MDISETEKPIRQKGIKERIHFINLKQFVWLLLYFYMVEYEPMQSHFQNFEYLPVHGNYTVL